MKRLFIGNVDIEEYEQMIARFNAYMMMHYQSALQEEQTKREKEKALRARLDKLNKRVENDLKKSRKKGGKASLDHKSQKLQNESNKPGNNFKK